MLLFDTIIHGHLESMVRIFYFDISLSSLLNLINVLQELLIRSNSFVKLKFRNDESVKHLMTYVYLNY